MRALSIAEAGAAPVAADLPPPEPGPGDALVQVSRAAINPVDLAIASGRFPLPVPSPPYVPGAEVVGEVLRSEMLPPGTRVWGIGLTGGCAEVAVVPDDKLVPVPEGVGDDLAVALGIAGLAGWMPVLDRGALVPGETVVVLGAGGAVGQVAVQAARSAGAGRVVAAARSAGGRERALVLGADAAVATGDGLAEALRAECPDGADLVIDPLWGASAVAALSCLSPRGRLVQVGNAESPVADVAAAALRFGLLDIRGFSVLVEDPARVRSAYAEIAAAALEGEVAMLVETVPLGEGPAAWARQASGAGGIKAAVDPR
ncbi:MAG: zinc-binding alcohol dehydrogenase family protein [Thermoleophilia bacterium]